MGNRTDRELQSRERTSRSNNYSYKPASQLPDPNPQDGYTFRWVRTAIMGQSDSRNVSTQRRDGYEPVRAEDHPELMLSMDHHSGASGNVEIGGLMLCKAPTEKIEARQAYYEDVNNQQIRSVDNSFMRENDPRMPLFSEKRSEVSFTKR
jgi:hypothetical protein